MSSQHQQPLSNPQSSIDVITKTTNHNAMPRRPVRLDLANPNKRSPSPSSLSLPLSPLTPPLRLHLRSLIPSPPLTPHFLATQPEIPRPLVWRCHICDRLYPLSVTRRCLEDGHRSCTVAGKGKRHCIVHFDHSAWAKFNIWRRDFARKMNEREKTGEVGFGFGYGVNIPILSTPEQSPWERNTTNKEPEVFYTAKDFRPLFEQWDCWQECNFPSECHQFRQWQAREKRRLSSINREKQEVSVLDGQVLEQELLRAEEEERMQRDFYGIDDSSDDSSTNSSSCYSPTEDAEDDEVKEMKILDEALKLNPLFDSGVGFCVKPETQSNNFDPGLPRKEEKDVKTRD